jgi:cob(I)alamin adenosyltransferase
LVVELSQNPHEAVAHSVQLYLNRLSDLLFVLARVVNHRAGVSDVVWKGM